MFTDLRLALRILSRQPSLSQWGARAIVSQLYHVAPSDPMTLVSVVIMVLGAAALAAAAPALRATRVDPAVVLRAQ